VSVRLWIPGRKCKGNVKVGFTATELADGLIKLVQPQAVVSVVCKTCVLLP